MDVGGFPENLLGYYQTRGLEFVGEVVGVDFDSVRILRLKHAFRDDERFSFLLDSPFKLRFADGFPMDKRELVPAQTFDVAICTYGLHDDDVDTSRAIKGMARSVKDDGICLVATHKRTSFEEICILYQKACTAEKLYVQAKAEFKHFNHFAQEDAQARLEQWFGHVDLDDCDTSLR